MYENTKPQNAIPDFWEVKPIYLFENTKPQNVTWFLGGKANLLVWKHQATKCDLIFGR